MAIGSFCLVLHGHMPYVLRHGLWPHGEDWLYEAAAETYLPLLATIAECRFLNGNPRLTLGLTPILLEQMAHDDFKSGLTEYLRDRRERARADHRDFKGAGQLHMAYLATRWEEFYSTLAEQFAAIDRDIPRAFSRQAEDGYIEVLTSGATHGYLPLLLEDSSIHAQVRAGIGSSQRILGRRPKGMWLPEGAYRPSGHWVPGVAWGASDCRIGLERFLADEGLTHFFVESHLVESSHVHDNGHHAGASVQEPVWVTSDGFDGPGVAAFARDPYICKQVWCGFVGYPANGTYLEFHKRHGARRGLRYWKITNRESDLGAKDLYYPDDVEGRIFEHAHHFCDQVRRRLYEYHQRTGRHGIVAACFDAELFGHWWFEGPRFLRDVLLTLNADPDIELCTAEEYLRAHPPEKRVCLPAGSWGEGGDHRVWANGNTEWIWQIEYRCETLFGKLTYHLPWRQDPVLREWLEKAGRELLLLQASDWPFVISRAQAIDYGIKRFMQHVSRFELYADLVERYAEDPKRRRRLSLVQQSEVKDAEIHDVVFPNINLDWWNT
jgi:1,4-alpha-glucan branching enzyme